MKIEIRRNFGGLNNCKVLQAYGDFYGCHQLLTPTLLFLQFSIFLKTNYSTSIQFVGLKFLIYLNLYIIFELGLSYMYNPEWAKISDFIKFQVHVLKIEFLVI